MSNDGSFLDDSLTAPGTRVEPVTTTPTELIRHFDLIRTAPGMFVSAGVEFAMLAGYIQGMIGAGIGELSGFQGWVSQSSFGSPDSSITWSAIIASEVSGQFSLRNLSADQSQAAFGRAIDLLIGFCESRETQ